MQDRCKIAAGNWKMHGLRADLAEISLLMSAHPNPASDVVICPPTTLIAAMAELAASHPMGLGGQDCHSAESGAFTGNVSAQMLHDAGARYVILGHSERRADPGETSALVQQKAQAALAAGLTPIICLGESLEQRQAGETLAIVTEQFNASLPEGASGDALVVAYEPIWAIGTGEVATPAQIADVHDSLRETALERLGASGAALPLLYGGSVKPGNAAEIFATSNVDGALVGGASLKAADFGAIVAALDAS